MGRIGGMVRTSNLPDPFSEEEVTTIRAEAEAIYATKRVKV